MNFSRFSAEADYIEKLSKKGSEIIAALAKFIEGDFNDYLKIVEKNSHRLEASFHGLPLTFRIEIVWAESGITGTLISAIRDYTSEGNETAIGSGYKFDELGNVGSLAVNRMVNSVSDFSQPFLGDILSICRSSGAVLRPGFTRRALPPQPLPPT